jgi:hypothetical protein
VDKLKDICCVGKVAHQQEAENEREKYQGLNKGEAKDHHRLQHWLRLWLARYALKSCRSSSALTKSCAYNCDRYTQSHRKGKSHKVNHRIEFLSIISNN